MNLVANGAIYVNTGTGPITANFPKNPKSGDVISITKFGGNDLTIEGGVVMGNTDRFVMDMEGTIDMLYTSKKNGWIIYQSGAIPDNWAEEWGVTEELEEQLQEPYSPIEKLGRKIID